MLAKLWLFTRSLAMTILFPGTVAIYIPYRLLVPISLPSLSTWYLTHYAGAILMASGAAILLKCIWEFATFGKGTLAPFDETKKLVVIGLYRYVRNPMYVGVVLILLGESWFFWSGRVLAYSGFCFIIANILVMGYEEHRLRHKYGEDYRGYCKHVGRWIPGSPYQDAG